MSSGIILANALRKSFENVRLSVCLSVSPSENTSTICGKTTVGKVDQVNDEEKKEEEDRCQTKLSIRPLGTDSSVCRVIMSVQTSSTPFAQGFLCTPSFKRR